MQDFLHVTLDKNQLFEMSSLALAHIGDAVFELMVRGDLCKNGIRRARELHKNTVLEVSASAQEAASKKILPLLTREETDVYLRGRNAKVNTLPKHATPETYHAATAFEALWGYLYLSGKYERLNELFEVITSKEI